MDRLTQRFEVAQAALASFEEVVGRASASDLERDAAILRFPYSFESIWKAAQHRLRERDGIDSGSPKQVIRACLEAGILDPERTQLALELADDRNMTVHTYNEPLARALAARLPGHARLLREWLEHLRS